MSLTPGGRVGPYVAQERLAESGSGERWAASEPGVGRRVDLTVIVLPADAAGREATRGLLRRRASLEHPCLPPVYDAGEDGDVAWIATRAPGGATLATGAALAPGHAARAVDALRGAVAALAGAGLAPTRVGPEDVVVEGGGVYLIPADYDAGTDAAAATADLDRLVGLRPRRPRRGLIAAAVVVAAAVALAVILLVRSSASSPQDAEAGHVIARIPLGTDNVERLTVGGGHAWVGACLKTVLSKDVPGPVCMTEALLRVDTTTNSVVGSPAVIGKDLPNNPEIIQRLRFFDGKLYSFIGATGPAGSSAIVVLDPATLRIERRHRASDPPDVIARNSILSGPACFFGNGARGALDVLDRRTLELTDQAVLSGCGDALVAGDGVAWAVNSSTVNSSSGASSGVVDRIALGTGDRARFGTLRFVFVRTKVEADRARAEATPENFAQLAREHQAPHCVLMSGERCLRWDYNHPPDPPMPPIGAGERAAVFPEFVALKDSEISRPLKSPRLAPGWLIVQFTATGPPYFSGDETTHIFAGSGPGDAALTDRGLWVTDPADGLVLLISPDGRRVVDVLPDILRGGKSPSSAIAGDGAVWVGEEGGPTSAGGAGGGVIHRIETQRGVEVGAPIALSHLKAFSLDSGEGSVWAIDGSDLVRIEPTKHPAPQSQQPASAGVLTAGPQRDHGQRRRAESFAVAMSLVVPSESWFHVTPNDPAAVRFKWTPQPTNPDAEVAIASPRQVFRDNGGVTPVRSVAQFVAGLRANRTLRLVSQHPAPLGGIGGVELEVAAHPKPQVLRPGTPFDTVCPQDSPRRCSLLYPLPNATIVLTPRSPVRLRVAAWEGRVIVVRLPIGAPFGPDFDRQAADMIDSIRFGDG